ncbi:MAG: hypothetical protein JWL64_1796, partial [Frankiales bacterium]|nr:hypothetical protein [Frankiales bacterium]
TRGAVTAVAQPVVRLSDGEIVGYEVLARMPGTGRGPQHWLTQAQEVGLRQELELACLRSVPDLGEPPSGHALFINVSPATLRTPQARDLLLAVQAPLVLELAESDSAVSEDDFALLRQTLEPYVARGARVAVDDSGTAFASLRHVFELRPSFLKIAAPLVNRLEDDLGHQALVRALVAFAREVGVAVVAEGVETGAEHEALRTAGVDLAQGFWFARPHAAFPELRRQAVPAPRQAPTRTSQVPALAEAVDAQAACDAVADHLYRRDGLMPSIFLERGGRLRCQSARGYWQIFDGVPTDTGVIGATFTTGERTFLQGVGGQPDYLEAVPGVEDELCVPLTVHGRTVGCINVESFTGLSTASQRVVDACTVLLGERLGQLGLPTETTSQKLGRHAAQLAELAGHGTERDLHESMLRAAIEVSGMDSAAICLLDGGQPRVLIADGPLASALLELPEPLLDRMRLWVDSGTSSYTVGRTGGVGFPGQELMRRQGFNSLALMPLTGGGSPPGFILVAARDLQAIDTERIALLELLAAEVSACLRVAVGVRDLRDRADRDALTGLGHHGSFHARLPLARSNAQHRRLAVLYVDVDHFKRVNDSHGHAEGDRLLIAIASSMQRALRGRDLVFRIGGDEFAALAEVVSEEEALAVGQRLREAVSEATGTSLSVGVAVAGPGDSDASLLKRADRALYLVKHEGRGAVRVLSAPVAEAAAAAGQGPPDPSAPDRT